MAKQRKLGLTASQRKALLRNQVTNLIWYGRIETTLARAKEVRPIAEHLVTLAIAECDNNIEVEKTFNNDKGQAVTVKVQNDAPSKLNARRRMMRVLYPMKETKKADENKAEFRARTKDVKYPWLHAHPEEGPAPRRRSRDGHSRVYLISEIGEAVSQREAASLLIEEG